MGGFSHKFPSIRNAHKEIYCLLEQIDFKKLKWWTLERGLEKEIAVQREKEGSRGRRRGDKCEQGSERIQVLVVSKRRE